MQIPFDSGLSNSTRDFEVNALSANIDEINGHAIAQDNLRRNSHQHIFSSLSIPENIYPISLTHVHKGTIMLFGKVETLPNTYVSCCAHILNNQRYLYILPRKNDDGVYESMADIHT